MHAVDVMCQSIWRYLELEKEFRTVQGSSIPFGSRFPGGACSRRGVFWGGGGGGVLATIGQIHSGLQESTFGSRTSRLISRRLVLGSLLGAAGSSSCLCQLSVQISRHLGG